MSRSEPIPVCPICGSTAQERYRPFCSKRCADIDLHRWLAGAYVVPTDEPAEDGPAAAEADPERQRPH